MARKGKKRNGRRKVPNSVKPIVLANNQAPSQIGPKRKGKRSARRAGSMAHPGHVRAVCSITDPFCPASKNAKWPDGTSGNTLTEQFRGNFTLTASAGGNLAACFKAEAPFGYIISTMAAQVATWQANYTSYRTGSLLETYGSDYRIVSCGVIVRTTASASNASGLVTFGTCPAITPGATHTIGTELFSEVTVKAIQPGLEFTWISQPAGAECRNFIGQNTASNGKTSDWTALIIEISGVTASLAVLNVEWFVNVEFLPLITARALTSMARVNPPKSTAAESAVSKIHSDVGSFIDGGVRQAEAVIANAASAALSSFMADPLESIAGLFAML